MYSIIIIIIIIIIINKWMFVNFSLLWNNFPVCVCVCVCVLCFLGGGAGGQVIIYLWS